jgi:hypothetical protein
MVLGAVAVVGVLVAGVGFYAYHTAKSGYFLKAQGEKVLIFQGKADGFLGLKLTSQAAKNQQPTVRLSELPNDLRKDIAAQKQQPGSLAEIRKRVDGAKCVYTFQVTRDEKFVLIKTASANKQCPTSMITTNPADGAPLIKPELKFLPKADVEPLDAGVAFNTLDEAVARLTAIGTKAGECASAPGKNGCPGRP